MKNLNLLLASMVLLSAPTYALQSDSKQEIVIRANSNTADLDSNTTTFLGNVVVTQGSIKLTANKLVGIRHKPGEEEMIATGNPATFYQMMDDGKPVEAKAKKIRYLKKNNQIILSQNASLKQLDSNYTAETITYNIDTRQIEGQKGENQTRTVFLPAQVDSKKSSKSSDKSIDKSTNKAAQ
ncbi:lipopolysaccharide transport periplasmic protein LptA [Motilimonas cestriensis]|uniref:Lipopolysaccharide export system protein LptA n=1 Tax=Motilimonas cestriensis TaxID=2742685 RepID=A0ABS8WCR5_9GAMM|nr:lipopolysaccharide transport periplasmic protein LptA [Motilimonas cestriensis]MCE2596063.1 lipopolysaccharide transport periplasmic protein LptA [Motilimonas cestriensis]